VRTIASTPSFFRKAKGATPPHPLNISPRIPGGGGGSLGPVALPKPPPIVSGGAVHGALAVPALRGVPPVELPRRRPRPRPPPPARAPTAIPANLPPGMVHGGTPLPARRRPRGMGPPPPPGPPVPVVTRPWGGEWGVPSPRWGPGPDPREVERHARSMWDLDALVRPPPLSPPSTLDADGV